MNASFNFYRKLALIVLCFCFAFSTASAQKCEIGLNGGIVWNTPPSYLPQNPFNPSDLSFTYGLKLIFNFKKWQTGFSLNFMQLTYNNIYIGSFQPGSMSAPFTEEPRNGKKIVVANPAVPLCFFVNRKINFKRLEVYGGISVGAAYLAQRYENYRGEKIYNEGAAFTVGAQLGGTYYITKRIGFNAEFNANYMKLRWFHRDFIFPNDKDQYHLIAFPATLGIRYRFNPK